ncbi:uncharacterized protein H6S33_005410 [Morchella sextelata]|uniref:uncharacterized protein n=1 Tax=Morchella sextelata TaxID=1174677 RepID=UPI001D0527E2|nr:uncharacterized protein H6S33_005410 [Morchella sextelata]KAH0613524.1 hypothetical protein H6S33_005410 [Morchella sextelata]
MTETYDIHLFLAKDNLVNTGAASRRARRHLRSAVVGWKEGSLFGRRPGSCYAAAAAQLRGVSYITTYVGVSKLKVGSGRGANINIFPDR